MTKLLNNIVLSGTILAVFLFGIAGTSSRSQGTDAARAAVVAVENDWLSHLSDGPSLARILADDFMHPVPAGLLLNKQEHIKWAVEHPRPAGSRDRFERLEVRVYGATAIANGIVESRDTAEGKVRRTIFTDVFVYRDSRWQAVNAQENEIDNGRFSIGVALGAWVLSARK